MNTEHIWTYSGRMSGEPCVRGSRLTVCTVLTDLANGKKPEEIAKTFDMTTEDIVGVLNDLAMEMRCFGLSDEKRREILERDFSQQNEGKRFS